MSREEIVDGLELYTIGKPLKSRVFITVQELQDFIDAIKALEQEPILDKIRAEITSCRHRDKGWGYIDGIDKALEIIDKYKAESEVPYNDKASAIHSEVYTEE